MHCQFSPFLWIAKGVKSFLGLQECYFVNMNMSLAEYFKIYCIHEIRICLNRCFQCGIIIPNILNIILNIFKHNIQIFPCYTLCLISEFILKKLTCMFCSCNWKLKLDLSFIELELHETSMANVYYNKECGNNKSPI